MLIRDIIAHLRHGDCGGGAVKVERLTGIESVSNRPVGVEAPRLRCRCCGYDRSCSFAGLAAEIDGSKIASALGNPARKSGAEMRTASNREAVNNALTKPLDTRPRKDILRFCDPTSQNFLASETTIADSADRTLVVDRRSAVGTSLPQAASKRALPAKTRQ